MHFENFAVVAHICLIPVKAALSFSKSRIFTFSTILDEISMSSGILVYKSSSEDVSDEIYTLAVYRE